MCNEQQNSRLGMCKEEECDLRVNRRSSNISSKMKRRNCVVNMSLSLGLIVLVSFCTTMTLAASTSSLKLEDEQSTAGDEELVHTSSLDLEANNIVIRCESSGIRIRIPSPHTHFSGMVYPQVSIFVKKETMGGNDCFRLCSPFVSIIDVN